jgi:hypothetical protein
MQVTFNWPARGPFSRSSLTQLHLETFSQHRTDAALCDHDSDIRNGIFENACLALIFARGDDCRPRRWAIVQQRDDGVHVEIGV